MEIKRCARCDTIKPVTEFFANKARYDGLSGYCRPCQTAANNGRQAAQRVRVMEVLGGPHCVRCCFDDVRALVIDHIDGGGSQHRRDSVSVWVMNKYVLEHPEEFQVLCANCNQIKRHENDEWAGKAYVAKVQETRREIAPKTSRWARDFDSCTACSTTDAKHKSGGLCLNCYMRLRRNGTTSREKTRQRQSDSAKARWASGDHPGGDTTGRRMVTSPDGSRHWSYPGDDDYPGPVEPAPSPVKQ